jgi:hydroxymethylglutaryl-CoA reductase
VRNVSSLTLEQAGRLTENVVGVQDRKPAQERLRINGEERTLTVVGGPSTELPPGTQFKSSATPAITIAHSLFHPEPEKADAFIAQIQTMQPELLAAAKAELPNLEKYGRGIVAIEAIKVGEFVKLRVKFDCGNAMGANMGIRLIEALTKCAYERTQVRYSMRIISNDGQGRTGTSVARIPVPASRRAELAALVARIDSGEVDAVLHVNTEIVRGAVSLCAATGNDDRAVVASSDLFARDAAGAYQPLAQFKLEGEGEDCVLVIQSTIPTIAGTTGRVWDMPFSADVLKSMGSPSAQTLSESMASMAALGAYEGLLTLPTRTQTHGGTSSRSFSAPSSPPISTIPTKTKDLTVEERRRVFADAMGQDSSIFNGLDPETVEQDPTVKHTLPTSIVMARINGDICSIPFRLEEPSVCAATSYAAAKLLADGMSASFFRVRDKIVVTVRGELPAKNVKGGLPMLQAMEEGCEFAKVDSERNVTNNKGALNAIMPVIDAYGGDRVKAGMFALFHADDQPFYDWRVVGDKLTCTGVIIFPEDAFTCKAPDKGTEAVEGITGHPSAEEIAMRAGVAGALANGAALRGIIALPEVPGTGDGMMKHRQLHDKAKTK